MDAWAFSNIAQGSGMNFLLKFANTVPFWRLSLLYRLVFLRLHINYNAPFNWLYWLINFIVILVLLVLCFQPVCLGVLFSDLGCFERCFYLHFSKVLYISQYMLANKWQKISVQKSNLWQSFTVTLLHSFSTKKHWVYFHTVKCPALCILDTQI